MGDGVRYGLCSCCRDARRENPDYDLCGKCKRQAEISGAGFGSGQHTFCRPEDMESLANMDAANALLAASLDVNTMNIEAAKALLAASLDVSTMNIDAAKSLLAASLDVSKMNIETLGHPSYDHAR